MSFRQFSYNLSLIQALSNTQRAGGRWRDGGVFLFVFFFWLVWVLFILSCASFKYKTL